MEAGRIGKKTTRKEGVEEGEDEEGREENGNGDEQTVDGRVKE